MSSLRIDNIGRVNDCGSFGEFQPYFWRDDLLFLVRGCFGLLEAQRGFCGHFVIFDGLGSSFF